MLEGRQGKFTTIPHNSRVINKYRDIRTIIDNLSHDTCHSFIILENK